MLGCDNVDNLSFSIVLVSIMYFALRSTLELIIPYYCGKPTSRSSWLATSADATSLLPSLLMIGLLLRTIASIEEMG